MIRLFNVLFLFGILSLSNQQAISGDAGFGTYSLGYRYGDLTKCSNKSSKGLIVSLECELILGNAGSSKVAHILKGKILEKNEIEKEKDNKKVKKKQISPWLFSGKKDLYDKVTSKIGEKVVISYDQVTIADGTKETDYAIKNINNIETKKLRTNSYEIEQPTAIGIGGLSNIRSRGIRGGRIVKASHKGLVGATKSFELIVQMGDAGNRFWQTSITDEALYNFAVECLKRGKIVRLSYVEYRSKLFSGNWTESTPYEVWKIEVAGK